MVRPLFACCVVVLLCACSGSSGGASDPGPSDVPVVADLHDVQADPGPLDVEGDVPAVDPGAVDVSIQDGAEATDEAPELPPFEEPPARVLFDLFATPVETPFPSNYYVGPDGHLVVDQDTHSCVLLPMVQDNDVYRTAMTAGRGFSPYAPLGFLASVPLDPSSLPADGTASVADNASIQLWEVDPATGKPATRVPFGASYSEYPDEGRYLVTLLPHRLFLEGRTYLLVITDGVKTLDGQTLARSRGFAQLLGLAAVDADADPIRKVLLLAERGRIKPFVDALPSPDSVIAAVDFTIGADSDETRTLMERFLKGGEFQTVDYDLDPDKDGTPNVLSAAQYTDCKVDASYFAYGLYGTFDHVNFTGPDGLFVRKDGKFQTFPPEHVEFWLMVPTGGPGPHPIALVMHGIQSSHDAMCGISREFLKQGFAVLLFDWPKHGNRGSGALEFLGIDNPLKGRDNFRQAAADVSSAILLLERLAKEVDRMPLEAPDGLPDLDVSKIVYLGHSLGGIIGVLHLPFSDRIGAMLANVTGVGVFHLMEFYMNTVLLPGVFGGVGPLFAAQHFMWLGDGVTFAPHLVDAPYSVAQGGKDLLIQEATEDETVPNTATEALARSANLKVIEPVAEPIDGVGSVPAAGVSSGIFQFLGSFHGFLFDSDDPGQKLGRAQALHFLKTRVTTGKAEILDALPQ